MRTHCVVLLGPMPHGFVTHAVPVALHTNPAAHVPQVAVLPQLSRAEPHTRPLQAMPFGMQAQVPGPPLLPLHAPPSGQTGPQTMVPPQPSAIEPQVLLPQACAIVSGMQVQLPGVVDGQTSGAVQRPQLMVPPQLSPVEPQLLRTPLVVQAASCVSGVQPQVPGPPLAPLQTCEPVQAGPQLTVPPQPSGALPQLALPQTSALGNGTHPHVPAVPPLAMLQRVGAVQTPQL